MFNAIDICSFIPVSACHGVGMGPGALVCPGRLVILLRRPWMDSLLDFSIAYNTKIQGGRQ